MLEILNIAWCSASDYLISHIMTRSYMGSLHAQRTNHFYDLHTRQEVEETLNVVNNILKVFN